MDYLTGILILLIIVRSADLFACIAPQSIMLEDVKVGDKASVGHRELMLTRWKLLLGSGKPMGGMFYEISAPGLEQFLRGDKTNKDLAAVPDVTVQGVNIGALLKWTHSWIAPNFTFETKLHPHSDRMLLHATLRRGDKTVDSWELEKLGDPKSESAQLTEALLDSAMFHLIFRLAREDKKGFDLLRRRFITPEAVSLVAATRSPEGLEHFCLGSYYLRRYYVTQAQTDLELAIQHLRQLHALVPDHPNTTLLLGIALTENRETEEAPYLLERAAKARRGIERARVELMLAEAQMRRYTAESSVQALATLKGIPSRPAELTAEEAVEWHEIAWYVASLEAHLYGLCLAYLRHSPDAVKAAHRLTSNNRADMAQELWTRHRDALAALPSALTRRLGPRAWGAPTAATSAAPGSDSFPELARLKDGNNRTRKLRALAYQAAGNGFLRKAAFSEPSRAKLDLDHAIHLLGVANQSLPEHFGILEYLGLAHLNRGILDADLLRPGDDPSLYLDDDIVLAERFFLRARTLKPTDYYAHELLSHVTLLHVEKYGPSVALARAQAGVGYAQKSVELRPGSIPLHLDVAELHAVLWSSEVDPTKRSALSQAVNESLLVAARLEPSDAFSARYGWLKYVRDTLDLRDRAQTMKEPEFAKVADDIKKNLVTLRSTIHQQLSTTPPPIRETRAQLNAVERRVRALHEVILHARDKQEFAQLRIRWTPLAP